MAVMKYQCYELLHGGEGPRGRSVEILLCVDPMHAAKLAAEYFTEIDMKEQKYGFDDANGEKRIIEIEGEGKFFVVTEAVLKYRVNPINSPQTVSCFIGP